MTGWTRVGILGAALSVGHCADEADPLVLGDGADPSAVFEPVDCSGPADVQVWAPEEYESVSRPLSLGTRDDAADLVVSTEVWTARFDGDRLDRSTVDDRFSAIAWGELRPAPDGDAYRVALLWDILIRRDIDPPSPRSAMFLVHDASFDPASGAWEPILGSDTEIPFGDEYPVPHDFGIRPGGSFGLVSRSQELALYLAGRTDAWTRVVDGPLVVAAAVPNAAILAYRTERQPSLQVVPFDFATGRPSGDDWQVTACRSLARAPVRGPDVDIVAAGESIFVASTCTDATVVQRYTSRGAFRAEFRWPGAPVAAARATVDEAGHLVVAHWLADDPSPTVDLLRPDDLAPVREAVTIPRDADYPTRGSELAVIARPTGAGEVFVAYSYVIGHGAGEVELARLRLCEGE
jgi:hypothetical protein